VVLERVWCANHSMLDYIAIAHGVPTYLIADLPEWATIERFDVEGQFPQGRRVPTYIVDFFYPAATRPQPPLANLLRERTGLRVHSERRELATYDLLPLRDDGQFGPSLCRGTGSECEASVTERGGDDLRRFVSSGVEWNETFAAVLARELRRPVIDRTGLRGPFSLELRLPSDRDPDSYIAAVRDQLGLSLQESRAAMTVLVIDHIERPTAN
jgi:bla regulator protein blaR1